MNEAAVIQWFIRNSMGRRKHLWGFVNFLRPRHALENRSNAKIIDKCYDVLMNAANPMCPISIHRFHCPSLHCAAFDGYSFAALSSSFSSLPFILERPKISWLNPHLSWLNPHLCPCPHICYLDSRSIYMIFSIIIMASRSTHPPIAILRNVPFNSHFRFIYKMQLHVTFAFVRRCRDEHCWTFVVPHRSALSARPAVAFNPWRRQRQRFTNNDHFIYVFFLFFFFVSLWAPLFVAHRTN